MSIRTLADGRELVSVGDCPACSTFAPVLVLASVDSGQLVFFCPGCETAWRNPPPTGVLDEVPSIEEVAPLGVRLPRRQEFASLAGRTLFEVDLSVWADELAFVLTEVS